MYREHAPRVAAMLRHGFHFQSAGRDCRFHGTRSEFDLEDRLQEVFARVFSERARLAYDGIHPFSAYITTIARNLVIDDFRKRRRRSSSTRSRPPTRRITARRTKRASRSSDASSPPVARTSIKPTRRSPRWFRSSRPSSEAASGKCSSCASRRSSSTRTSRT
ncbi:MAG: hypothetical protein HC923_12225 [Myxococcales bacterium]|nr:hypothetical protein [Myxococcales bacterium]